MDFYLASLFIVNKLSTWNVVEFFNSNLEIPEHMMLHLLQRLVFSSEC